MTTFTYVGPEIAVEIFGVIFPRGQPIVVDEENKHAMEKLAVHPQFERQGEGEPERRRRGRPPKVITYGQNEE